MHEVIVKHDDSLIGRTLFLLKIKGMVGWLQQDKRPNAVITYLQ